MAEQIATQAPATCYELQVSPDDLKDIDRDDLLRMLLLLYLVRDFEDTVLDLKDAELVHGPAHTSQGQEAVAAAVAAVLRKDDMISSTHRAHGHFLSKAFMYYAPDGYRPLADDVTSPMREAVNRTLAEIMGLKAGWCGGRGGSMHLYDATSGNLGSNAIVGGGIPIATGAAWAQRIQKKDAVVVSFFGDGAINQGCFHEVANMAALWDCPILYLVENNLYAVGTCTSESSCVEDLAKRTLGYGFDSMIVDGMDPLAMYIAVRDVIEKMRTQPYPYLIEAKTYRHFHHAGRIRGSAFGYRERDEEAVYLEKDPVLRFPETLREHGLLSDDEDERLRALSAELMDEALAFCTAESSGQRVIPAELWPTPESATVDVRCADPNDDIRYIEREDVADAELKKMTYVEAIAGVTLRSMERDERVVVLGEEVANLRGGAYQATRGIKEAYPERLFNTPISETGFVGMSGGLAAVGLRPITEIMFPDFALMSSDQLFNQIGKLRHMYGGQVCFPVLLRTRMAMGYGYGGQHSMDPSGVFGLFPGWRVMAPSNAFDYIGMFNTAMRFDDPVLILEHGLLYAEEDQVPAEDMDYYVAYGKAKTLQEGDALTVLTYSYGVTLCRQALEQATAQGASVELIDLRTLDYTGMDYEAIGRSIQKTGAVLVVNQAARSLSIGARIAEEVQRRFFDYLDAPVAQVTALDAPLPVSKKLEEAVLPSVEEIATAMARGSQHMF
jgi:2-oxoisovalerate dehydrogenase E1 component